MVIREEGFPVMTSMTKCLSLTDPSATLPAIKNLLRKVERHVKKNGDLDVSSLTTGDGTHELTEMMVAEI